MKRSYRLSEGELQWQFDCALRRKQNRWAQGWRVRILYMICMWCYFPN